jgi:hypothetical protein
LLRHVAIAPFLKIQGREQGRLKGISPPRRLSFSIAGTGNIPQSQINGNGGGLNFGTFCPEVIPSMRQQGCRRRKMLAFTPQKQGWEYKTIAYPIFVQKYGFIMRFKSV